MISSFLTSILADPVIRKRARHVISENGRVLEAIKVLKDNNIADSANS